jgi:DMSO/TMAO reductase YedYZ heme-binding membrane subunit
MTKIWSVAIGAVVVIVAFLTLTSIGHVIDLAVQHFMLFYAGVFALIALCASVGAGLVSTDRIVLNPGHRVWVQSAHRAISFGALTFLIIHIVTEILAQRVHVIDAVVPFLSPFRTFYIGLGTIASDLIILLVITGILRKRFTGNGKSVWRWRAIHYTSYVAFVFGVWHGLLGGRPGKPYVDWSYGFVVAFVGLGLAVRILANSLRPKESLSAAPVAESASSGSAPMRAAVMLAQLSAVRAGAPAAMTALGGTAAMLPAAGPASGPMRAIPALPAAGTGYVGQPGYEAQGYEAPGYNQIAIQGAPVYEPGYEGPPRFEGAPRPTTGPMPVFPGRPVVPSSTVSGPLPQVPGPPSGGFQGPGTGPMPQATAVPEDSMSQAPGQGEWGAPYVGGHRAGAPEGQAPGRATGPMPGVPGAPSGGFQRPATGPMPRVQGPGSGGFPRPATGPMPGVPGVPSGGFQRPATGPMSRFQGPGLGGSPRPVTGPMPRVQGPGSGGSPRPMTGPMPQAGPAAVPQGGAPWVSGPQSVVPPGDDRGGFPRPMTGPMPQVPGGTSGPQQRPMPQPMTGPAGYDDPGYGWAPRWDEATQDAEYGFPGGDGLR